jgi:glycosyltransferase involved in cell wall biosynthesis
MRICLIGPCSPHDISRYLLDFNPDEYEEVQFYRGIPVSTLAIKLLESGNEVEIVTSAFGVFDHELNFKGPKITITIIKSTDSTRNRALTLFRDDRKRITKVLEKSKADIFHAHWTYEFALAALSTQKKVLVTAHDAPLKILFHYRDAYRFLRFLMAVIVRMRAKHLAAVSPYLADNWRRHMIWRKPVIILPNFTPVEMLPDSDPNARLNYSVLCVSDSSKLKNVKTLIKAWKIVVSEIPQANLRLVGIGLGEGEEIHDWAKLSGLAEAIEWVGYVERTSILKELSSATVLCHPSLEESHSLVLVESLAMGLPIIGGKNSGAVPWTLGDAGLLVDVKSEIEIADALIQLLLNLELRSKFSELAHLRSTSIFSEEITLPRYIRAYKDILEFG